MAIRRTWNVGLRSVPRSAAPVSCECRASFASKADLDEDGEAYRHKKKKWKKGEQKPSFVKKSDEKKPPDPLESHPDYPLIKALKRQLKHATVAADQYQAEVRGSFKPFDVVPNEEGSDLTLRRIIGKEEVLVKCLLDLEKPTVNGHAENASKSEAASSDDSEDLGVWQHVTMNVQISKQSSKEDQPQVAFLCSYAKGQSVTIEDITYSGDSIDEDHPYSGPSFSDLDSKLKQVFQNVIRTRGINANLANTVMTHLTMQYQDDYLQWLKKVREFVIR